MQRLAQFSILVATFFAVWSTSGTRSLSCGILLVLSAIAFVFSILSWGFEKNSNFSSLVKNPFLIGGGFLVLLGVIQVLNPRILTYDVDSYAHVRMLDYIKWLPSGVKADAEVYSTAKAVAGLISTYLFANAIWFQSKNARFCKLLLKFFALNISTMSIYAIIQHSLKAKAVYFIFSTDAGFYGPYYYGNATAVAIFLGICACVSAFLLDFNAAKNLKAKTLSFLWIALSIASTISIFYQSSIGAKLAFVIFVILLFAIGILYLILKKIGVLKTTFTFAILFLISIYPTFYTLNHLYQKLPPTEKSSVYGRLELANIAKDVFLDAPILGSGADSFGYLAATHKDKNFKGFANSTHNSLLSYACEYGIVGLLAISLVFFTWAKRLYSRRKFLIGVNIICLAGFATCSLHSLFDIFLQIPSTMWFYALFMMLSASIFKGGKNEI